VTTSSDSVAIGTLKVEDLVIAYNSATGQTQAEPVQHVFVNHDDNLLDVTLTTTSDAQPVTDGSKAPNKAQDFATLSHGKHAGPSTSTDSSVRTASQTTTETLHTTTEHPFLTTDRGFVDAIKLVSGEHVQMLDGSVGTVVKTVVVPGVDVRYNLTVQDLHSFAVGQDQWVVHNCGAGSPDPAKKVPNQPNLYSGQRVEPQQLIDNGYNMTRNVRAAANSTEITDHFGTEDVTKVMQTWEREGTTPIENHYWVNNKTGDMVHYHKVGEVNISPDKPQGDFSDLENMFLDSAEEE
jgi:Pretoxin HINT domain